MITAKKDLFLNAIRSVRNCVAKLSINPVLNCINIVSKDGKLILTATDLNTSGRSCCEAIITDEVNICLNAQKLENIVSRLDDEITLNIEDNYLTIKSGQSLFKALITPSTEFPEVEFDTESEGTTHIQFPSNIFVDSINKTLVATTTDENTVFGGVCLSIYDDGYELASTDGNRLCVVNHNGNGGEPNKQYIIPQKLLHNLNKIEDGFIDIYTKSNYIILKTSNSIFKQNLFAGLFPKYQQLIPKEFEKTAIVNKKKLIDSLEKVAIMCDDRTNIATFSFDTQGLTIKTASEHGNAKDEIEIECNSPIDIAFNYKYILEGVKVMNQEEVVFSLNNATSACLIKGDYIYLVMPVNQNRGE